MVARWSLLFIVAVLLLGGLADNFARTIVEMPAWRHVGVEAWADFSRQADLGNGKIVYPIAGIGTMLLTVGAAIAFRRSPQRPRSAAIPVYGAALMAIAVLLATTQAAPLMLSLPRLGRDPVALQKAFDGFDHWGNIRAVFAGIGYVCQIWALAALARLAARRPAGPGEPLAGANP
ncbi:MAG: hypothetical protein WB680_07725 [Candidatus Acidiferrales bacterium]